MPLFLLAVGFAAYTQVHEPWQAFGAAAIVGVGNGAFWPSQSALIIGLTPPARRHAAFALQRVMRNLGVGLGGVAGGLIATTSNPTSYTVLFALDAVTFLVFVLVLWFVPDPGLSREESEEPGRYREVLRNRVFLGVVGLNAVYVAAGYALLEVFPVFAKNEAGVTERQIGFIFFVNTLAIVLAQLPLTKVLEGRRRMPALALMTFIWAATWMIVFAGGVWFYAGSAALVFGLAGIAFGLGECFHGPTQGALVADLAPPRLRGRYMALSTLSWEIGFVIGPTAAGFILHARTERAVADRVGRVRARGVRGTAAREADPARAARHSFVGPKPPPPGVSIRRTSPAARSRGRLRRQLLVVQEVAPRFPGLPAVRAARARAGAARR